MGVEVRISVQVEVSGPRREIAPVAKYLATTLRGIGKVEVSAKPAPQDDDDDVDTDE